MFPNDLMFQLVKELLDKSMNEMRYSIYWYEFKIIPLYNKYHTLIDGNFEKRIWWFIMKEL